MERTIYSRDKEGTKGTVTFITNSNPFPENYEVLKYTAHLLSRYPNGRMPGIIFDTSEPVFDSHQNFPKEEPLFLEIIGENLSKETPVVHSFKIFQKEIDGEAYIQGSHFWKEPVLVSTLDSIPYTMHFHNLIHSAFN